MEPHRHRPLAGAAVSHGVQGNDSEITHMHAGIEQLSKRTVGARFLSGGMGGYRQAKGKLE